MRVSTFRRLALSAGICLTTLVASASPAAAYCRTTTCDPKVSCTADPKNCCTVINGCDINGVPISWPNSCTSYNIYEGDSELRGITSKELSDIVDAAFEQWSEVDCGGDPISLALENRGFSSCGEPEYNEELDDDNANVWMFRDSGEIAGEEPDGGDPIDARTLAVTTLSIDVDTGAIYGVDVEINTAIADFTTDDDDVRIDLASVVTHEAGHFLGLDHSRADAVMTPTYSPGDIDPRQLKPDDEEGICAIYPLDRSISENTCEPRGNYSPACHVETGGCGCRIAEKPSAPLPPGAWLGFLAAGGLLIRRRQRQA